MAFVYRMLYSDMYLLFHLEFCQLPILHPYPICSLITYGTRYNYILVYKRWWTKNILNFAQQKIYICCMLFTKLIEHVCLKRWECNKIRKFLQVSKVFRNNRLSHRTKWQKVRTVYCSYTIPIIPNRNDERTYHRTHFLPTYYYCNEFEKNEYAKKRKRFERSIVRTKNKSPQ